MTTRAEAPDRDLLQRCVHCGFCLPTCPTYAVLGVEMDSPRGRIRLMQNVLDGRVAADSPAFETHISRCLDCRACETACPSGVEYGKLFESARALIAHERAPSPAGRLIRLVAFRALLPRPLVLAAFAQASAIAKRLGLAGLLRRAGLRRLGDLLALVPSHPSSRASFDRVAVHGTPRGRVALFTGCVMRAAFADTNAATARVLARNGYEVVVPKEQTCCGALHAHAGDGEDARALARRNIAALEGQAVDAFIVNAAGCGAHLKGYGWLLRDDPQWRDRAAAFSSRVRDATEHLGKEGLAVAPGPQSGRVAYDEPCHLLHGQKISREPKALLAAIPGIEVAPLAEAEWCCGSAGSYNVTQPDLSRALLERKIAHVVASGADILVTANPGCQMQLAAGLHEAGSRVRVMHLMDLLDRAYGGG